MRKTMRAMRRTLGCVAAAAAILLTASSAGATGGPAQGGATAFELLGRYTTGLADPANEIVSGEVAAIDGPRMYVTNADDVSLDVVDISDPSAPALRSRIDLSAYGATATSVAAKLGLVAVAVANGANPGVVVFLDRDGAFLGKATVGAGPDMVTFAGPFRVLVANEGEPEGYEPGQLDPPGSVTVIDVLRLKKLKILGVRTAGFAHFDGEADELRAAGVRIFGPNASVSQDLEPEYIAVDPLLTKAYVTLQENNAIAVLDLVGTPRFDEIHPLGTKDHSQPGHGFDASDRDDGVNLENWPVRGIYMPDGIAAYRAGFRTYLVTANEGDARGYDGLEEEADAGDVADLDAIPAADDNAQLGRLNVTTAFPASGDSGQQELFSFGARSFSIWNAATGEQVYDSGDRLERLTAHVLPDHFNSTNATNNFDDRSDAKGPEPEAAAVGQVGGRTYAFIGLERVGGVVVADVTDPHAPEIVQYLLSRDFSGEAVGPDSGPEVIDFVPALLSPTGNAMIAVSNEVTGTVSLWGATQADGPGPLTLLHNNDGESSLLPLVNTVSGQQLPVGGAGAFKAVTDREIEAARLASHSVLDVYAGDAFLASATLTCSLEDPTLDVYDAVAQRQISYDAHILGNHEFDYTPDFLERFIRSFETGGVLGQPFLSSNLDVSAEPGLAALRQPGGLIVGETTDGKVIARSAIVRDLVTTRRFGIVGATTWTLPIVSSPRNVVVSSTDAASTAAVVQAEIDRLHTLGVRKIIFVSHLQDVTNDKAVVALLSGVDVAVAGGGDELLANSAADLLPGDPAPVGTYPVFQTDADGDGVPIVTTAGNYKYLGRLVVSFDAAGEVAAIGPSSKPVRVIPESAVATALALPDAVERDAGIVTTVEEPIAECLAELAATPVAFSELAFDVSRPPIRDRGTNGGNLVADAWLAAYDAYSATSGLPPAGPGNPLIAIQNGGGIRQQGGNTLPPAGANQIISRLDVINVLPFDNTVVVVGGMTPADVKAMLELSASQLPGQFGGFLQIAGFDVTYDRSHPAGSRVVSVALDDGTPLVTGGMVDPAAPASLSVVTNNFTANGGDGYAILASKAKTTLRDGEGLAIPYELGLREYLLSFPQVSGTPTISAGDARYAPFPSGEVRITILP
jgi:2',3'-cyclic-nucleotide 2'-phosphodiesterase (5'-nucleotidase family)